MGGLARAPLVPPALSRDRQAIKALSAPDIVVETTVEALRGTEALLEWMDDGDDAFDDFTAVALALSRD